MITDVEVVTQHESSHTGSVINPIVQPIVSMLDDVLARMLHEELGN